jgi:hypothetical protein
MANTFSTINLTSLDPDTLMEEFRTFMRSQTLYKDYDYEGAAMSALLRILGHNTYLYAFYLNMLASEAIGIDTAQTRSALISHAKELNYVPRSARSAVANVTFSFNGTEPSYLIQKGQIFSTTVRNNSLNFTVPENVLVTSTNSHFSLTTQIYEGPFMTDSYIMNYNDETQRFALSNKNVDTRSITVVAYEDGSTSGLLYGEATTLLGVNENTKAWFLQANENEGFEIVFGDGVIGRRPKDGSLIVIDYRITVGSQGNGAKVFSPNFSPATANGITGTISNVVVTTNQISIDGSDRETDESIRYNATRHFQVQERAATAEDFAIILQQQFPEITAISTYGGEEADPPRYGRVYIAINIQGVDGLPESKVDEYTRFLATKQMLNRHSLTFVKPQYTYVKINTDVTYNINVTRLTIQNIQALVINRIQAFNEDFLADFQSTLRYSKLVQAIDESDDSILGNETDLQVYKKVLPVLGSPQNLDINFAMPLYQSNPDDDLIHSTRESHTISSTPFIFNGDTVRLDDDGMGSVYIQRRVGDNSEFVRKVGTINYTTGKIQLASFQIDDYDGTYFKVYARTAEKNILSDKATILLIEDEEITVTVEDVRE